MGVLPNERTAILGDWLAEEPALWIRLELHHYAGAPFTHLVRSVAEIEALIKSHDYPRMTLYAFRRLPFELRGDADPSMLQRALDLLRPGEPFDVVALDVEFPSEVDSMDGDTHGELRAAITAFAGRPVAVGRNPFDYDSAWVHDAPGEVLVVHLSKEGDSYATA